MSSKVAPAYIIKHPEGREFTDDERRDLVEAIKESGPSPTIVVEERPDGQPLLLHDPRPSVTLYHYTSQRQWERVQRDGYLRVGPQGFVALTDEPNLRPASPNAHWATAGPLDKTQVRITVITHEADPFIEYCEHNNVDPAWVARATQQDSPEHWYALDRPVPVTEWVEVRLGDTPVAKRSLPRRRRDDQRPIWQTSSGMGSRCDFCGLDEHTACYRYECRPFMVDDWHNGDPDGDPGDADWAACWFCADLIQKRDIPALLARGDAEMTGVPVEPFGKHGGKHGGVYDPDRSHARVRAFFQHYTKRRWFVGKCDFCSIRGESVRWMYDCGAFSTQHPMTGVTVHNDSPWCVCETCSKLIERGKQKPLAERSLEHQLDIIIQEGDLERITPAYRAKARIAMTTWVSLFFQKRKGPRRPIPDLPPRVEIPQAPVAAQHALDEQTTMLRWLEGSDGRDYLGGWNDRYKGHVDELPTAGRRVGGERPATRDELAVWTLPLRYGEAFYWEPRVADAIRQASAELASNPDVPFIMRAQTLPASYGFFYSNEQLGTSAGFPCRAIGWAIYDSANDLGMVSDDTHSMIVGMWPNGGGDPSIARGVVLTFWSERPQDTVLRPSGQVLWSFGVDFRKVKTYADADSQGDEQTTMVAAMFQFVQQRIVVAGHGQPVRADIRKRIEREFPEHRKTVRVVTLRRTQRADYQRPDEPTDRGLSYQFKVHGHWRNQCFNTAGHAEAERLGIGCNDHMTIYVHDYFKGPEGAPELPEADRVYDVAR